MAQTEREKELYDLAYGNVLNGAQAEKPVYDGTYESRLNELFDKIANREKFSYDVNKDPLYGTYKDEYIQQGKLAMKDTMGQAAALTGGYGSTYGQQVGQQAYDAYLQKLSAAIPELYGMAYKMYQDEGDQLKDLYGMVGAQRDAEYGRYRDALGDWERGQAVLRDLEAQEHDRRLQAEAIAREQERYDYQKAWDEDQRAYERNRYAEQTAYDREQQAAAIQRQLENQEYTRRTAEEQEAYNRQKYNEQVGRQLEQQEYERQKYEEEIQRKLEQQEYERRIYDEEVRRKQDQQAWERQQQAYSNLYAIIKATGYMPSEDELAAAGMSYEEANALSGEFFNQRAQEELAADLAMDRATYGGSSGGGRSYSGGSSGYGGYDYDYDYDYDYTPAASTGLVSAGAGKTRSQVFNDAKKALALGKENGGINQTEFNQVAQQLIASGHSGSTAAGRAKENQYLAQKTIEEIIKKNKANGGR